MWKTPSPGATDTAWHIHLLVTAPGFTELFTPHDPVPGSAEAAFDLELLPLPMKTRVHLCRALKLGILQG